MNDEPKAVFLSYASQDAEAAKRICDALRQAGVEVWFDQSELVGGDAWDAKIRGQIGSCALFVPVISAATQARGEGYFRLEWHLAEQRTYLMAHDRTFLFPVIIDDTRDAEARVPDRFRERQWTRLPQGLTDEQFCARVKALLAGDSLRSSMPGPAARTTPRQETPARITTKERRESRSWLWLAIPVVLVGLYFLALPRLKSPAEVPGAVAPEAKVAVSEVDRLLGRIWDLVYHAGMARTALEAADQICRRASELDPTNAELWAAWAHAHTWMIFHRFDESDARRLAAQDSAARAMSLAPDSFEARLAQAMFFLRSRGASETQVKESNLMLRTLLREKPEDPRAQFLLGDSLLKNDQTWAEGAELLNRLAGNPQMAGLAWMEIGWNHYFRERFAEADRAIERSIAAGAYWNNCALKTRLALQWHGDLEAAKSWLEKLPPADLKHDFVLAHQFMLYTWRREPKRVIPLLQDHPREWLSSNPYDGPKSLLLGRARRMAGQEAAAGKEFRLALELIEARLQKRPNDGALLRLKAEVLFYLGDRPVADDAYRQVQEVSSSTLELNVLFTPADSVINQLERRFDQLNYNTTAASFRLDPLYDPIRSHPRFQALIARAGASSQHTPNPKTTALPTISDKSVAVLAFANLSDDKANEYFSDGISEELLNVLAKVPGLKVTARTSAFHFKGKDTPIPEIAKQLGVAYVVEGSVRKAGDKVRITAQLVKAADGFHVWSDTFTRDLKDIFAVQDEIAGLIAENLQLKMGIAQGAPRRTIDPAAYQEYLAGRADVERASTASLNTAIGRFQRIVAAEPDYAPAWVQLSRTYVLLARWGRIPLETGWTEARRAVARAVELEPDSPDVLVALGWVRRTADWNWRGAEQAFRRALELRPNHAETLVSAAVLFFNVGKEAEALRLAQRAVELDPLNPAVQVDLSQLFRMSDQPAEAVRAMRRALQLAPDGENYHGLLAFCLIIGREFDEAEKEASLEPYEATRLAARGRIALARGRPAEARKQVNLLQEWESSRPGEADVNNFIAGILAGLGDKAEAFARLEKARATRDPSIPWLRNLTDVRALHADPRWQVLLHKIGLTDEQLK